MAHCNVTEYNEKTTNVHDQEMPLSQIILFYLWYIATLQNMMNKTTVLYDEEMPLSQMLSYLWYIATLQNTMNKTRIVHDQEIPLSQLILSYLRCIAMFKNNYEHISI